MSKKNDTAPHQTPKKPRGFAAWSPEKRAEAARQGGLAAQASGKAHRFTSDEAKAAGSKGGRAPHKSRGSKKAAAE